MRTTIDGAGRLVIPKAARDALGLTPGTPVDIVYADGRIEIEIAPLSVELDVSERLPRLRPLEGTTSLTDAAVRGALENGRR